MARLGAVFVSRMWENIRGFLRVVKKVSQWDGFWKGLGEEECADGGGGL